jgi:hypothetical protein
MSSISASASCDIPRESRSSFMRLPISRLFSLFFIGTTISKKLCGGGALRTRQPHEIEKPAWDDKCHHPRAYNPRKRIAVPHENANDANKQKPTQQIIATKGMVEKGGVLL